MNRIDYENNSGFATIPTILAVSAIILVIAFGIVTSTFTESVSSSAEKQSAIAYNFAEDGAKDALLRIARDKNYSCVSLDCYSLDLAPNGCANSVGCAKVSVSNGTGAKADPKIITSSGIVQNKTRKIEVQVIYDSLGLGQVGTTTWQELTN
jgi:hypothetical protein